MPVIVPDGIAVKSVEGLTLSAATIPAPVRAAAPVVVSLVGGDARLEEYVRRARVVPHRPDDVALFAGALGKCGGQFRHVNTADPYLALRVLGLQDVGHRPVATILQPRGRVLQATPLRFPGQIKRAADETSAVAAVPPESKDFESVIRRLRGRVVR